MMCCGDFGRPDSDPLRFSNQEFDGHGGATLIMVIAFCTSLFMLHPLVRARTLTDLKSSLLTAVLWSCWELSVPSARSLGAELFISRFSMLVFAAE